MNDKWCHATAFSGEGNKTEFDILVDKNFQSELIKDSAKRNLNTNNLKSIEIKEKEQKS